MTAENVRPLPHEQGPRWPRFDVGTLDEISPAGPAYDWHVTGFLEPQTRLVIAGDEAAGKSLLTQQIAVRLAAGIPVIDGASTSDRVRVVVIDTELHERTIRRRLVPMARHAKLPAGQLFYLLASSGLDLTSDQDAIELTRIVGAVHPDVVIIDSLYRAFDGDPDDPRVIGKLQRVLDELRTQTGAALILCAHFRKRSSDGRYTRTLDDLAGSRLMKAWPELVLDVTPSKLRVLKDREGMAPELLLERRGPGEWETDPDGWPFTLTDADTGQQQPTWQGHTLIQSGLLDVLAAATLPLSSNQVINALKDRRQQQGHKGFRRETVLAALGELKTKHHVQDEAGTGGAQRWTITPDGLLAHSTDAPVPRTPGTTGNHTEPVAGESGSQTPSLPYGEGALGNHTSDQFPHPGTSQAHQW